MELGFLVLADHGTNRLDGKFDLIGAGFDTIFVPEAPARHARFVVAVRFLLTREEAAAGVRTAQE